MDTKEQEMERALSAYQEHRQFVEDRFATLPWYPGWNRDYNADVGKCHRSLGASVAAIYGTAVTATAARARTGEAPE